MQVQSCIQDTSAVQRAHVAPVDRSGPIAAGPIDLRHCAHGSGCMARDGSTTTANAITAPICRPHTAAHHAPGLEEAAVHSPGWPTCPSQVQLRSAQPGTGTTPRTHDSHTASHATRSPQPPHRYPPRPHTTQLQRRAPWPRWCHSRAQVTRVPGGRHSARRAGCTKPSASQNNAPHTSSEK